MVQIKETKEGTPSAGRPFRFWVKFRLRLRRRRQMLRGNFKDSVSSFKDIESEDGRRGEHFDLRKMGRRENKGFRRFVHNWALVGTGRWCKLARNRLLLRGEEHLSWMVRGRKADKGKSEGKVASSLDLECKTFADKISELEKQVGRVRIGSWVNDKARQSLHSPLIGQVCVDKQPTVVAGQTKEESYRVDGCFGWSGPRIWRSKEKDRRELEEIVDSSSDSGHQFKEGRDNNLLYAEEPPVLPDEIVEMCLAWTPFASLMRARAVCKKWKSLSLSPHFLQLRESICSQEPWLFLFGLARDGVCLGEIQALDSTLNKWHTIKADSLSGRLLYSVTAVNSVIYVIGGCSMHTSNSSGRNEKNSPKTLKSVLMYSPLTGSWRKVRPMIAERASPIVGVFKWKGKWSLGDEGLDKELGHPVARGHTSRVSDPHIELSSPAKRRVWDRGSRRGGELAVYGGTEGRGREGSDVESWHNCAALEALADLENHSKNYGEAIQVRLSNLRVHGPDRISKEQRKSALIVVGGQGKWSEQLDSAEIYDPVTDRWREIASLPVDHGIPCAGVVCKNFFYVYSESNKLAAYDLEHDVWQSILVSQAPARLLDYTPKLVSCRGRVFLLGVAWGVIAEGGPEMATRKIWELHQEPAFIGWVKVSQHPDAPLDWNAVFVADEEKIFGVEMFKIFGQMLDFVTVCKISGSKVMGWERVTQMQMGTQEIDPSSCHTKTAVMVQL